MCILAWPLLSLLPPCLFLREQSARTGLDPATPGHEPFPTAEGADRSAASTSIPLHRQHNAHVTTPSTRVPCRPASAHPYTYSQPQRAQHVFMPEMHAAAPDECEWMSPKRPSPPSPPPTSVSKSPPDSVGGTSVGSYRPIAPVHSNPLLSCVFMCVRARSCGLTSHIQCSIRGERRHLMQSISRCGMISRAAVYPPPRMTCILLRGMISRAAVAEREIFPHLLQEASRISEDPVRLAVEAEGLATH